MWNIYQGADFFLPSFFGKYDLCRKLQYTVLQFFLSFKMGLLKNVLRKVETFDLMF